MGVGTQVRIGFDAILGCTQHIFFPHKLLNILSTLRGLFTLNKIGKEIETSIWSRGLLSSQEVGMEGINAQDWNMFLMN